MHCDQIRVRRPLIPSVADQAVVQDLQLNHPPVPAPALPRTESEHFRRRQNLFRPVARDLLRSRGDFLGIPQYKYGPLVGAVSQCSANVSFSVDQDMNNQGYSLRFTAIT